MTPCFQETRESVTVSAAKDHIYKLVQILKINLRKEFKLVTCYSADYITVNT